MKRAPFYDPDQTDAKRKGPSWLTRLTWPHVLMGMLILLAIVFSLGMMLS